MGVARVQIKAPRQSVFTRAEARQMVGQTFPMTSAKGEVRGEGVVRKARVVDPITLELHIEVPDHLMTNLTLG